MVLESNHEIIGAAIISNTESEHRATIISLYMLPDKIGQGFGHNFFSAIEIELRERGFWNCTVDVLESNTRAIRFYKAHGFVETDKTTVATLGKWDFICRVFEKAL